LHGFLLFSTSATISMTLSPLNVSMSDGRGNVSPRSSATSILLSKTSVAMITASSSVLPSV